jgi:Protein of unknown function (DUF3738)
MRSRAARDRRGAGKTLRTGFFQARLHVFVGTGVSQSEGSILVRILGLYLMASSALFAQRAASRFDVASVKRATADPGVTPGLYEPEGRVAYRLAPMRLIIERAYNLKSSPQVEGPDWLDGERYDIDATLPEGTSKQHVPAMLRALLEQRFKLSAHTVTREAPTFALLVGEAGSKLTPAKGVAVVIACNGTGQACTSNRICP